MVRPLVSAIRTASRLNSSLCLAAISGLLDGEYRSQVTGIKPGQVHAARIAISGALGKADLLLSAKDD
jgi:hypothetical protein